MRKKHLSEKDEWIFRPRASDDMEISDDGFRAFGRMVVVRKNILRDEYELDDDLRDGS